MPEVLSSEIQQVRPLFSDLELSHALVPAFFEGSASAHLFVDDAKSPQAAILVCNSRVLCTGETSQQTFMHEMEQRFANELIPSHTARGNDVYLAYASGDAWTAALQNIFPDRKLYHGTRQYYETTDFMPRTDLEIPDGFSIQLITPEFLSSKLEGLDAVKEEMCSERASVEDYLARSFGICPVYENEIAGWCMSEYNVGNRCEIGIATMPNHQRKGIATRATWHFLAEAHRRGYTRVGWDCWTRNEASAATARKAGFTLIEEYPAIVVEL